MLPVFSNCFSVFWMFIFVVVMYFIYTIQLVLCYHNRHNVSYINNPVYLTNSTYVWNFLPNANYPVHCTRLILTTFIHVKFSLRHIWLDKHIQINWPVYNPCANEGHSYVTYLCKLSMDYQDLKRTCINLCTSF